MSTHPGDPGKGTQARAAALVAGVRRPTLGIRRPGRCRVRTAAASMPARPAGRPGSWLSVRYSLRAEAVLVLVLYGVYEATRPRRRRHT